MKLIFFAFKHRYRYKDLNNFLNSRFYGKYFLLNLGGPFKHFIARVLLKLKFGFAISCDARPLIESKKSGINFFIRGTNLNIPTHYRNLENNYVSIKNPFKKENNIFQIYPINLTKSKIDPKSKIIFIGGANLELTDKQKILWEKHKDKVLSNFTILDNYNFWQTILDKKDDNDLFVNYKKFKLLLRYEIIKHIKVKFEEKFILVGDDWESYSIKSLPSNFNISYVKDLYKGNICLDFGSAEGSSSLYSRSNQIIESGGLILQSRQCDYKNIWENIDKQILFDNFTNLENLINKLLSDNYLSNKILSNISKKFSNSKKLIEANLDYIFKKNLI